MRKFLCIILTLSCLSAWGQKADLRQGNREFKKGEYAKADISYRKALVKDTSSVAAHYNLANNLYRQQNMEEAAKQLESVQLTAGEEAFAGDYYFNSGDVAIAKEDWQTAVNMFKESLRRNPGDMAAKENYIYARNKLMEQQQQQQDQQQNQDQDQNQNQDQDQNQDQQQQPQDQDQNQDKQDQQPQPQPQQQELSAQQAQQLLQAIQEKEKQTQEKVDEKKAQALKSRQKDKNW